MRGSEDGTFGGDGLIVAPKSSTLRQGTFIPEIAAKLTIKTGKNAGKHPGRIPLPRPGRSRHTAPHGPRVTSFVLTKPRAFTMVDLVCDTRG